MSNRAQRESDSADQYASLAGFAHDLAKVAGVIELRARALRRELEGSPGHDEVKWIESRTHDICVGLRELIDECGSRYLESPSSSTPRSLVSRVLEIVDRSRVIVSIQEDSKALVARPRAVERILLNLIDNAIQASPADRPVELSLEASDHQIVFTIANHGAGDGASLPCVLFEPFVSGGRSKSSSGLGLFVCRDLVDRLGGRLESRHEAGRIEVSVMLPCARS